MGGFVFDHVAHLVGLLLLALSFLLLPPELLLFVFFIPAGVADSFLGDFILKVGGRVIWKEPKRTWETR